MPPRRAADPDARGCVRVCGHAAPRSVASCGWRRRASPRGRVPGATLPSMRVARRLDGVERRERARGRRRLPRRAAARLESSRLTSSHVGAELEQQDVAVERREVDEDAVDAVAQAARRAALLVVFEGLELGAQRRRHRPARARCRASAARARAPRRRARSVMALASSPAIARSRAAVDTALARRADTERELAASRRGGRAPLRWWRAGAPCRCGSAPRARPARRARRSTPSRRTRSSATSAMLGTRSRTVRTRERIVGMRSASLGAHRIHTVRSGGSSSALSSTFEVRSVMRSASSIDDDAVAADRRASSASAATSSRTSSILMMTPSVASTCRSGWLRAST